MRLQLDRDLQKIRLQREQEQEEQLERARELERELGRQQQQPKAAAPAAEDDVVVLLGSEDEGEEEAVEVRDCFNLCPRRLTQIHNTRANQFPLLVCPAGFFQCCGL